MPKVGGQAVIEGVMMRSGETIATAVRRKNGEIETRIETKIPWSKRNRFLALPIIRGTLNLVEMLVIGISALNWSAEIADADEKAAAGKEFKKTATWPAMFIGLVLGVALFVLLPLLISKLFGLERHAFTFNLVAGFVRMAIFFAYLIAISFMPDVKRLFSYHGAEHKSIFAFEHGEPLTTANAQKYKTLHPRCGTSFLLIVAVVAILFFAVADSIFASIIGFVPHIVVRFVFHLLLWPLLAGICYEVLKLSAKLSNKYKWAKLLVLPGLAMQKITTSEPDDDMLEVALVALKEAVGPMNSSELMTQK